MLKLINLDALRAERKAAKLDGFFIGLFSLQHCDVFMFLSELVLRRQQQKIKQSLSQYAGILDVITISNTFSLIRYSQILVL